MNENWKRSNAASISVDTVLTRTAKEMDSTMTNECLEGLLDKDLYTKRLYSVISPKLTPKLKNTYNYYSFKIHQSLKIIL